MYCNIGLSFRWTLPLSQLWILPNLGWFTVFAYLVEIRATRSQIRQLITMRLVMSKISALVWKIRPIEQKKHKHPYVHTNGISWDEEDEEKTEKSLSGFQELAPLSPLLSRELIYVYVYVLPPNFERDSLTRLLYTMSKWHGGKSRTAIIRCLDLYVEILFFIWWPRRHTFSLFHILGCPSRGSNSGLPYSSTTRYLWATSPPWCGLRRLPYM